MFASYRAVVITGGPNCAGSSVGPVRRCRGVALHAPEQRMQRFVGAELNQRMQVIWHEHPTQQSRRGPKRVLRQCARCCFGGGPVLKTGFAFGYDRGDEISMMRYGNAAFA